MALNKTDRKKLAQALAATGRRKLSDQDLETAAIALIDGKKTIQELAEKFEVTPQTLRQRLRGLCEPPNGAVDKTSQEAS
jgi:transposase-like protein